MINIEDCFPETIAENLQSFEKVDTLSPHKEKESL